MKIFKVYQALSIGLLLIFIVTKTFTMEKEAEQELIIGKDSTQNDSQEEAKKVLENLKKWVAERKWRQLSLEKYKHTRCSRSDERFANRIDILANRPTKKLIDAIQSIDNSKVAKLLMEYPQLLDVKVECEKNNDYSFYPVALAFMYTNTSYNSMTKPEREIKRANIIRLFGEKGFDFVLLGDGFLSRCVWRYFLCMKDFKNNDNLPVEQIKAMLDYLPSEKIGQEYEKIKHMFMPKADISIEYLTHKPAESYFPQLEALFTNKLEK